MNVNFLIGYKVQFLKHYLLLFILSFILNIHSWYGVVQQGAAL